MQLAAPTICLQFSHSTHTACGTSRCLRCTNTLLTAPTYSTDVPLAVAYNIHTLLTALTHCCQYLTRLTEPADVDKVLTGRFKSAGNTHTLPAVPTHCQQYSHTVNSTHTLLAVPTPCQQYSHTVNSTHTLLAVPTHCQQYPHTVNSTHTLLAVLTGCDDGAV
jgi:hypothetical protein